MVVWSSVVKNDFASLVQRNKTVLLAAHSDGFDLGRHGFSLAQGATYGAGGGR